MTSETDAEFVERMTPFHSIKSTDSVRLPGDDFARLFALARRGADAEPCSDYQEVFDPIHPDYTPYSEK